MRPGLPKAIALFWNITCYKVILFTFYHISEEKGGSHLSKANLESLKPLPLILSNPTAFSLSRVSISQLLILSFFSVGSFISAFKYILVSQAWQKMKISFDLAASTWLLFCVLLPYLNKLLEQVTYSSCLSFSYHQLPPLNLTLWPPPYPHCWSVWCPNQWLWWHLTSSHYFWPRSAILITTIYWVAIMC